MFRSWKDHNLLESRRYVKRRPYILLGKLSNCKHTNRSRLVCSGPISIGKLSVSISRMSINQVVK